MQLKIGFSVWYYQLRCLCLDRIVFGGVDVVDVVAGGGGGGLVASVDQVDSIFSSSY